MTRFKAYEDNGGGVFLFVLDEDGNAVAGFGNFEYNPGSLKDTIDALTEDGDAWKLFGGDFGGDIEMPVKVTDYWTPEDGTVTEEHELTIQELYSEYADDTTTMLIAWSDGESVYYSDPERMGFAAREALNLHDEDNC